MKTTFADPGDDDDDQDYKKPADPPADQARRELDDTKNVVNTKAKMTKAEQAAAMRIRGLTITEIRAVLEYDSDMQVRHAIEAVVADSLDNYDRAELRNLVGSRLEVLWRLTYKRAADEKNPQRETATKNALAVLSRLSEMHGLDAPKEIVMHSATASEIQEWLHEINTNPKQLPEEADIIDADIEDDDVV